MSKIIIVLLTTFLSLSSTLSLASPSINSDLSCSSPDATYHIASGCTSNKITRKELELKISTNQDVSDLDISAITDLSGLFKANSNFNQDISKWDTSNVFSMAEMFSGATAFNQNISDWDTSNVVNMTSMFKDATSFNQDITNWDVSSVFSMMEMFNRATSFNQDISNWKVKDVSNMSRMFKDAIAFNQDISGWDVAYVDYMAEMFSGATAFNQNISDWDVSRVTQSMGFRDQSVLTCQNTPDLPKIFTNCMGSKVQEVAKLEPIMAPTPTPIVPTIESPTSTPEIPTTPVVEIEPEVVHKPTPSNNGFFARTVAKTQGGLSSALTSISSIFSSNKSAKDVIKDKVVSYTEQTINEKANATINAYTPGKTKISIKGIQNSSPQVSIQTIQPLSELNEDSRSLTFAQGSIANNTGVTGDRTTINVGIGQRYLSRDDQAIAGANVFFDHELDTNHKRASIGLEYKRSNFSANYNNYIPLSNEKVVGIHDEEIMSGQDLRLSGQMPYMPWAKLKYNKYSWDSDSGEGESGNQLGVNVKLSQNTDLEVSKNFNKTTEDHISAKVSVTLPLAENERMTNFALDSKAFRESQKMSLADLDMVDRENDIKVKRSLTGTTVTMGVFNATTTGASCSLKTSIGVPIYDIYNTPVAGTTDSTGMITIPYVLLPVSSTPVVANCIDGTYTDEATGATGTAAPTLNVAKLVTNPNASLELYATPVTEIAFSLANADLSNIEQKSIEIANIFGLQGADLATTKPEDINTTTPSDNDKGKYGLVLAAISQLESDGEDLDSLKTAISTTSKLPDNKITNAIRKLADTNLNAGSKIDLNDKALDDLQNDTQPNPAILISVSDITIDEGASLDYTIALTTKPTSDVVISIQSTNSQLTAPATLTIPVADWWKKHPVTVSANVDTNTINETDTITHTVTSSGYTGVIASSIAVTVTDNDTPNITVSSVNQNLIETETDPLTGTITVVLDNEPTTDVIVNLSLNNDRVSIDNPVLTFTNTNWSTAQSVTVTLVNDDIANEINETIVTLSIDANSDDNFKSAFTPNQTQDITFTITDDDTAGVTMAIISGTTTEALGTGTFTVVLDSEPTTDVSISLSSDDISEGMVTSTTPIVFTSLDWNTPQTVTVTGVDDSIDDGDKTYNVFLNQITSSDNNYNGMASQSISFTNTDDDDSRIEVSETPLITSEGVGISGTSEGATADSFTIKLSTEPTGYVSIELSSDNPSEGVLDKSIVIFDQSNWDTAQTVTVTGVNDDIADGNVPFNVVIETAVSPSDSNYDGVNPVDVLVTNEDDDTAEIIISSNTVSTNESTESSDSFTVKLATEPSAQTTIIFTGIDSTEHTISGLPIVFDSSNYYVEQTVVVTGVNDDVDDGDQTYSITTSITGATEYTSLSQSVSVTNVDDDTLGFVFGVLTDNTSENDVSAGGVSEFLVRLESQPATGSVTLSFLSNDPTEGQVISSDLSFTTTNWQTDQRVTIQGQDDNVIDGNVVYSIVPTVNANYGSGYEVYNGELNGVSIMNIDDEPLPTVEFSSITSNGLESESSGTSTVNISLVSNQDITVDYTVAGTATGSGTDYTLASGTLTIPAGTTSETINITGIVDDIIDENPDETVVITLSSPSNATMGANTVHTYTIVDNDATPTVQFNATTSSGLESVSSASIQVDLTNPSSQDITVDYTVAGTATGSGTDYTLASGTLTILAGTTSETINITGIVDDILAENPNETVVITLSSPSNATMGANTVHTYTIVDDD